MVNKTRRLESLIGRAIPTLRMAMNNPNMSDGQRLLASETLEAIFKEQNEYIVLPSKDSK
jgi:hypothetical protein